MEPYVFLQAALWEGIPLTISVPQPSGPTRYEGNAVEPPLTTTSLQQPLSSAPRGCRCGEV